MSRKANPWKTGLLATSGLAAVREHFAMLSHRFRYEIPLTERALHNAACSAIVGVLHSAETCASTMPARRGCMRSVSSLAAIWFERWPWLDAIRRFTDHG